MNERIVTTADTAASTIAPKNAGAPRADYFLDYEDHRGDRRIESGRKASRSANGGD